MWTYELSQKYTYTHADSVQALAFNPVSPAVLASCSTVDFAIWTMPSSSLRKIKVPAKILCAAWTTDGQYLAIGMLNGLVSLRDNSGVEKLVIERPGPVWDLTWMPSKVEAEPYDTLAIACWDGTLSTYQLAGQQVGKDKQLGYDPTSVKLLGSGDYMVVAGSDKKATLMTRDGLIKLNSVAEGKDWLWRAAPRPRSSFIATASNDGTVSMHNVVFSTVHGLYQDRYAFREGMTDVVVQHLVTEARVRIKCRDYVKKIAVYRDRLAVQLPDRIIIYELTGGAEVKQQSALEKLNSSSNNVGGDGGKSKDDAAAAATMMYRVKDRIFQQLDCNLLVVTSAHVILCQEKKLQLYDFSGTKAREWVLEAVIRYIKVVGGPPGREGLLVGLKNGVVLKIFVDNPFPMHLIKHKAAIRCLDLSMSRRKLAVVDEASNCVVYDVLTGEQLFSEAGANSVAWNSQMEDMLCFSGNGMLSIKTGTFPLHQQKLTGFVVGFSGSKIFCLQSVAMQTIDVPQSASLYRYIDERDWDMAYRVACLGVTESDWRTLGDAALKAMQLGIARAAFVRLKDMRYIELINYIEAGRKARKGHKASSTAAGAAGEGGENAADSQYLAEVLAYAGKYQDAAKLHIKAGTVDKAVEMFADMRLWAEARKFAEEAAQGRVDVSGLMLKQAAWCEDSGDVTAAATIYSGLGMAARAVTLLAERGLYVQLLDLVRTFPSIGAATAGGDGDDGQRADGGGGTSPSSSSGSPRELYGGGAGSGGSGSVTRDVREALSAAGDAFRRADLIKYAREVYLKLGDMRALVQLHIDAGEWDDALALVARAAADEKAGKGGGIGASGLAAHVHLCKAEWLATVDRFEEARREYDFAGQPHMAAGILEQLAGHAVEEDRFEDAAVHYQRLAAHVASAITASTLSSQAAPALASRYRYYSHCSTVYRAYGLIHTFLTAPFTSATPEAIFQACRFVINACLGPVKGYSAGTAASTIIALSSRLPYRVSLMRTLYAMARQAVHLQAYRTARFALDRLGGLLVPSQWRDTVDLLALGVQTKPVVDREDLAPVCYRCGASSATIAAPAASLAVPPPPKPRLPMYRGAAAASSGAGATAAASSIDDPSGLLDHSPVPGIFSVQRCSGDVCASCGHGVVRSAMTFEPLPLVEFTPPSEVKLEDVTGLIGSQMEGAAGAGGGVGGDGVLGVVTTKGAVQSLSFTDSQHDNNNGSGRRPGGSGPTGEAAFSALLSSGGHNSAMGDAASGAAYGIVTVPLEILKTIEPSTVFVVRSTGTDGGRSLSVAASSSSSSSLLLPPRFFKNVIPEIALAMCPACCSFFHGEDWEMEVLKAGCCPACRTPADKIGF